MEDVIIFDTTLRDGEQSPGCSMSLEDKIKIAKMLDEAKVDVIEAGFAASNEKDFKAIKEISKVCTYSTVTSLARCNKRDIDLAYEAIKNAKKKRIHVFIATSDIHLRDKLKMSRDQVISKIREMVSYAKSKCDDIEFSLEDATRTDFVFACRAINTAIDAGATTINIPDTVGVMMPFEFAEFIMELKNYSRLGDVCISVHCHNDLGMATANSISAIKCGARQVECTINGIGERAGNTALEEVVATLDTRRKLFQVRSFVDTTMISKLSQAVCDATGSVIQNNKAIVGRNAFLHEAGIHQAGVLNNSLTYEIIDPKKYGIFHDNIVLGIHSGKNAIIDKMRKLGFNPDGYLIDDIVFSIKEYFQYNKEISDEIFRSIILEHKCKIYNKNS